MLISALCLGSLSSRTVLGATNILDLGKPTNTLSTNAYHPLGAFHRVSTGLVLHGKPEILFVGVSAPGYDSTSAEGWPLVKAIEQFGRLTGLKTLSHQCFTPSPPPGQAPSAPVCGNPGFDFRHASLRSPYVSFVYRDLGHAASCPFRKLASTEWRLFLRYARPTVRDRNELCGRLKTHLVETLVDFLPLLVVGNQVQASTDVVKTGDFQIYGSPQNPAATPGTQTPQALTFDQAHSALVGDSDPKGTTLVEDVNAEANIITALICHTDGSQPKSICSRSTIRQILKHVK